MLNVKPPYGARYFSNVSNLYFCTTFHLLVGNQMFFECYYFFLAERIKADNELVFLNSFLCSSVTCLRVHANSIDFEYPFSVSINRG